MKHTVDNMKAMDNAQVIVWALIIGIVALSGVYMYMVHKTVHNAVARESIQEEIVALNSKLSETEFQYINTVGSITMDTAREMGFKPVSEKITFVTRDVIGKNVAIR
jgi:hypothetical protein